MNRFSSVAQSCPTLCDPMNCSTPGLPVHHQFPELTQTHVHQVGDAIQPSHSLLSPSLPAPNPSQHQGLFQWVKRNQQILWGEMVCRMTDSFYCDCLSSGILASQVQAALIDLISKICISRPIRLLRALGCLCVISILLDTNQQSSEKERWLRMENSLQCVSLLAGFLGLSTLGCLSGCYIMDLCSLFFFNARFIVFFFCGRITWFNQVPHHSLKPALF